MFQFVWKKIVNKRWMALSLLVGNILLFSIVAGTPMYSEAVRQRTLTNLLAGSLTTTNEYPLQITVSGKLLAGAVFASDRETNLKRVEEIKKLPETTGAPVEALAEEYSIETSKAVIYTNGTTDGKQKKVTVATISDFSEHYTLLEGENPSELVQDGVLEGVLHKSLLNSLGVQIGDEIELTRLTLPDSNTAYRIRIVGVFETEQDEAYWSYFEDGTCDEVLVPMAAFQEAFVQDSTYPYEMNYRCSIYFNYQAIQTGEAIKLESGVERYMAENMPIGGSSPFRENIIETLGDFEQQGSQLASTLVVLQAPIFVLLAAFIFMVSQQMMQMEANEIAVLKSRGAGRRQIVGIYFLQSLEILVPALLIGYPLGYLVCRIVGSANAFLEFVQRAALPVRFTTTSLVYVLCAFVLSCLTMILPAIGYSRLTIVSQKLSRQVGIHKPLWQRFFFDLILLAVSLYALYSFNSQKEYLAQRILDGGSMDPLLYFSSALFILGAGLLGIRVLWLLIRLIYQASEKHWSPGLYASLSRVMRTRGSQSFIMIFMIFTIALGMYDSIAARSINSSWEEKVRYANGADVVVQEVWTKQNNQYVEPSIERYASIEGVESLTRVQYSENVSVRNQGETLQVAVMGIHTKEFGETVDFKTSLLPQHWYYYLNEMSQDPQGVLLSSDFQDLGYAVGDTIEYVYGSAKVGVIYGFVDYWPGYAPTVTVKSDSGSYIEEKQYLIIAQRDYLTLGTALQEPYQIWIKMEGSTQAIYDFAEEQGIYFSDFRDTSAMIIENKNDPILMGTNGVLTVDFVVVLLVCMIGFLIYWILSIRSRELQFGIFRAMGLSMREIFGMLLCEQLCISGGAIVVGVGVGALVTKLYLPLVQLAYTQADQVLPMEIVSNLSDFVRLFGVIGAMVLIGIVVLGILISRIHITQALKLGED